MQCFSIDICAVQLPCNLVCTALGARENNDPLHIGRSQKRGKLLVFCTCIQVMHPVPRRNFLFYVARIFVDDELNLPIRYEAYDWPSKQGEPPKLIEQYTYLDLKLNNGFTDADFDIRNPQYGF